MSDAVPSAVLPCEWCMALCICAASHCDTSKLEGLLSRIAQLFASREEILAGLRAKAAADCTDALMEQYSRASAAGPLSDDTKAAIVTSLLSPLDEQVSEIHRSLQEQDDILREVHEENERFVSSRECDPITQRRDELMQTFEQAVSAFFATHSQLNAGSTFYRDMQVRLGGLHLQTGVVAICSEGRL